MARTRISLKIKAPSDNIGSILEHAQALFEPVCMLTNEGIRKTSSDKRGFDYLFGIGFTEQISPEKVKFDTLNRFSQKSEDWIFGYLTYDLKNEIEDLKSNNPDFVKLPEMHFFHPRLVIAVSGNICTVDYFSYLDSREEVERTVRSLFSSEKDKISVPSKARNFRIDKRITKETYIDKINLIKHHIQVGDIYELNFCQEFYVNDCDISPEQLFQELYESARMPFSCYYVYKNKYLLCASPERFLKKTGNKILSQPIKGTIKRGKTAREDYELIRILQNDPKERSENVMIADLVRNDLSKISVRGSTIVKELCEIYTFPLLHQMISSIETELRSDIALTEILKATFPMGSMTGAPKIRAMQLIEEIEVSKRGLYSGAVGYITPEGDFDFNVVIRSYLYNRSERYLSFHTGSAITINSDPEQEYQECLLKGRNLAKLISKETEFI